MSVPKLRFKEFSGDWSKVTLEELAKIERGKFSIRPRNDPRYFGGDMPFVQTGDITSSDFYLKGFSQTLNDAGVKVSKVFPSNTILITIAANIGDTAITQYPIACPDSIVAIQPNKTLTDTVFLKNLIDLQKENLDSQSTQNAQKNINLQVLKPLELITPSKPEQTKIATFLTAVDEKISQLNQKQELLTQYKKGMMQKLFSQQIRFKADDGSEFGEWKVNKLGTFAITFSGGTPTSSNKDYYNGDIPFIKSGEISSSFTEQFINQKGLNNSSAKMIDKGDLLYALYGATSGQVAISRIHGAINQAVLCIRSKQNNVFLYNFFSSAKDDITSTYLQGGQGNLSAQILKNIEIPLPNLTEQTKIANFLSSIDQKIALTHQQLEQAKQWKKGLLQQMFI